MTSVLPWHSSIWRRVCAQIDTAKMPHGILITGPADSGKTEFISLLASYLLCDEAEKPCGYCKQCRLIAASTHPDMIFLSPRDSKQIKIEQVRDLIYWATQTPQQGGNKICIINPADRLNAQSANALLKVLEEPPKNTIICLASSQPARLLPTLRSRCQRIDLNLPEKKEAITWMKGQADSSIDLELQLDIADGMPLRALRSVDENYLKLRRDVAAQLVAISNGSASPVQVAASLAREEAGRIFDLLYQFVSDSIALTLVDEQFIKNKDLGRTIAEYSNFSSVADRYNLLDHIVTSRAQVDGTSNANNLMLLEAVFFRIAY